MTMQVNVFTYQVRVIAGSVWIKHFTKNSYIIAKEIKILGAQINQWSMQVINVKKKEMPTSE